MIVLVLVVGVVVATGIALVKKFGKDKVVAELEAAEKKVVDEAKTLTDKLREEGKKL